MSDAAAFVGGVPERYDRCLGPMLFEPFAQDLVKRISERPAANILELAAGTGIVSRLIIDDLPAHGSLAVTDLNPPMLEIARAKLSDDRVAFHAVDACDVQFPDESFDTIVCQFGLMFVPDKAAALRHMVRVLRSGGSAYVSVWDSLDANPVTSTTNELLCELYPEDPPKFYQVPFGMYDRQKVELMFHEAGFGTVEADTVEHPCVSKTVEHAVEGLIHGNPVGAEIAERGLHSTVEIAQLLGDRLRSRFGDNPMKATMKAHVIRAVKA